MSRLSTLRAHRLGFALFASQFVLLELGVRGARYWHDSLSWLSAFASIALWGLLGAATRNCTSRALISAFAAVTLVSECLFFRYYHSFIGEDAIACALSMWSDVRPVLYSMLPGAMLASLLVGAIEFLLLSYRPRFGRRAGGGLAALSLGLVVLTLKVHRAPAELSAIWSLRLLIRPREAMAEASVVVPPLESRHAQMPNVLLILDESIRASDYSLANTEAMDPAWRTLLPDRIELSEMRSLASYTAISVNALLSGIMPLGTRAEVAATPLLFDYLRSTRAGTKRPRVLYWSTQTASAFERSDPRRMADSVAFIEDILERKFESTEDVVRLGADSRLAERVTRKLPTEPRPLFLLAHLTDTHAPYHVNEGMTPFLPYSHAATWTGLDALHNAYRNAIAAQDRSVSAIVRSFVRVVGTEPYFILFTSDHGEAFGEHSAIHHGQNLYDEQIHVPAWLAFGNGAITTEQEQWLRAHASEFLTHLDILPTLLDLYGTLDAFGMLGARKKLLGRSLLRPFSAPSALLPISNCTKLFPCPLQTYGVMKDGLVLHAQPWNDAWQCVKFGAKNELLAHDTPACVELKEASRGIYPTLPNGGPNR